MEQNDRSIPSRDSSPSSPVYIESEHLTILMQTPFGRPNNGDLDFEDDDDLRSATDQALSEIKGMYDAGKPFFSRENLEAAASQFEAIKHFSSPRLVEVQLAGLDGKAFKTWVGLGLPLGRRHRLRKSEEVIERLTSQAGYDNDQLLDEDPPQQDGLLGRIPWDRSVARDKNGEEIEVERVVTNILLYYRPLARLIKEVSMAVHQPSELYRTVSTIQLVRTRNAKTGEFLEADKGAVYLSVEELNAKFSQICADWVASETWSKIRSILIANKHLIAATGASKIVAFALGDLAYVLSNSRWGLSIVERYMTQHAFLLTLREFFACLVERREGEEDAAPEYEVPCYAQEPRYCNNDKQLLEENFIQVLDDPKGFLEIDESSVVVSVSPNIAVREIVTDIARPAVLIWDFVGFDTELWVHIPQPTIYKAGSLSA